MREGSFSELPPDIHESIRENWGEVIRPASALLGISESAASPEVGVCFNDLSGLAISATSHEFEKLHKEREQAVYQFRNGVERAVKDPERDKCEIVYELLTEHFDKKLLPLDSDTLQMMVECTPGRSGDILSPLFTVWANRQRLLGNPKPKLKVNWPEANERLFFSFGEGMKNVDLEISGKVKGRLGTKAVNCQIKVTEFDGVLLEDAENSTAIAKVAKGSILKGAKKSTVRCKELEANRITLGYGCKLQATTATCPYFSSVEDGSEEDRACEVSIGHLYGNLTPKEGWKVNIIQRSDIPPQFYAHQSEEMSDEISDDYYWKFKSMFTDNSIFKKPRLPNNLQIDFPEVSPELDKIIYSEPTIITDFLHKNIPPADPSVFDKISYPENTINTSIISKQNDANKKITPTFWSIAMDEKNQIRGKKIKDKNKFPPEKDNG